MDAPRPAASLATLSGVQGATAGIDVATIGRNVEQRHVGTAFVIQASEQFRCDGGSGAVGAVSHDLQVCKRKAGKGIDEEFGMVIGLQRGIVFPTECEASRIGDFNLPRRDAESPLPSPTQQRRAICIHRRRRA